MADQVGAGLLSPLLRSLRIKAVRPFLAGSVLDFGCGVGALAPYCDPAGYLGVDRDEGSLALARQARAAYRFAATLPEHGSFETIVAIAVIEHLPDPGGLLSRLTTLMAPRGRIVVTTPEPRFEWLHAAGAAIGLFSRDAAEEHETLLDREALERLGRNAGLSVISYRHFMFGVNQLCVLEKSTAPCPSS
jgi:2-polyprenyl-3-methyl-5-hydroxy-6-metoxy-1,4-benzoquinol methylase